MSKARRYGKIRLYKEWLCIECGRAFDYYNKPTSCPTCHENAIDASLRSTVERELAK